MQSGQAEITQLNQNDYRISGTVDFSTVPNLMRQFTVLFKSHNKPSSPKSSTDSAGVKKPEETVTADLSQITGCNSAGLALLLDMYKHAWLKNVKLRFVNLPAPLLTIAKAYGVEREIKAICK